MKKFFHFIASMGFFIIVLTAHAQTVSVTIGSPASGGIANENVNVRAFVSSTYEIQSFQASVEGRTMDLFFDSGDPHEGWTNSIPLTGLTYGNKTLTVTATDGFGNSNQVQRSFVYDLRPTLNVTDPADGTVARPGGLIFSASAADDAPTGPTIRVNSAPYPPMLLATGTKTLNTNLFLADGQCLDVDFEASDSANQTTGAPRRRIYTQLSSNLVEIARVSRGQIQDVQPDRILFLFTEQAWGTSTRFPKLLIQSRTNGIETLVFQRTNMDVGPAFLAPQGTVLVASGSPFAGYTTGYGLYQTVGNTEIEHATHGLGGLGLVAKGNFAAWGWGNSGGFWPALYWTDLGATNTQLITNVVSGTSGFLYDLAANGDVVFALASGLPSHTIYRYRQGAIDSLANDPVNAISYPKTDGSNIYYLKTTSTNQASMLITEGGESKIAEGLAIGSDYQINNGWIAYERSGGGQMQIWRRSREGTGTQLTFFGNSSTLAALAPNGEVAFYNGSRLYISKGSWPPADIAAATPSLKVFWQNERWHASLGRSLFQIYTGAPQIVSRGITANQFGISLIGANGQRLITECTTNLVHWTAIATNDVADGANLEVQDPLTIDLPGKMYRLRLP